MDATIGGKERLVWPFASKISYKKVIEKIAEEAFHTSLLDTPGLADPPEELGSYTLNSLEGLAAVFFLVERSFLSITDQRNREKAKEYLASIVFHDLEDTYSRSEMERFVIPVLEKRLNEYHGILDRPEEPGERLYNLGSRMIANFIEEEVSPDRKGLAISVLINLSLEPAKILKRLEDGGQIQW